MLQDLVENQDLKAYEEELKKIKDLKHRMVGFND